MEYAATTFSSFNLLVIFAKKLLLPWMFEKVLSTRLCLVGTVGQALALHARASNFECF